MLNRRKFLKTTLVGSVIVSSMDRLAFAGAGGDARFVMIILRGGMDGLAAVPPWGESRYRQLRGSLALGAPGEPGGVLDLDGLFGLHPGLKNLHTLYNKKALLVAHAVATSYRQRSHFDGQKQLENGTNSPLGARDGWLNRALAHIPSGANDAIALAQTVPLILHGETKVNSWSPAVLPQADADTIARIARMYAVDSFFSRQFASALKTHAMADEMAGDGMTGGKRSRGRHDTSVVFKAAGRFLQDAGGPRIAVIGSGGWDTHANQGADSGQLANRLKQLDTDLDALQQSLGDAWQRTVVLVASEFGRTVAVNGSNGTDHGTANVVFILGGAVNGGRVISDWPGLASADLYQGRDLQPTMDMRSLFKSLLHQHLHVANGVLDSFIFPGSKRIKKIPDLLLAS